ncbi:MAG: SDR family NAD(P)-dependent oxidoreductase [Chitinivibrionales bacterium]|nr:SDR family NAD(P)-dependent oxidoreductase [Chitinivibrionales bacterium]
MHSGDKPIALITGATSGIGAAFARRLASAGCSLILTGRREEKLRSSTSELRAGGASQIDVLIGDLADEAHRSAIAKKIPTLPRLDFLVNNAGFNIHANVEEADPQQLRSIIDVHCTATVELTHAALGVMKRNGRGAIVNVSSLASFTPGSGSATYCATKAFVTTFTEALYLELSDSGIRVQALCPGWVRSDFHTRRGIMLSNMPAFLWMEADYVVNESLHALERKKILCIPKFRFKLIAFLCRHLPRVVYFSLMPTFRRLRQGWKK